MRFERRRVGGGHRADHPHSHVERPVHLVVGDSPEPLQHLEDRKHGPAPAIDPRRHALGQDAREVVGDPAAGDVRETMDEPLFDRALESRQVRTVLGQERRADRRREPGDDVARGFPRDVEEDLAGQRVTVRVQTGRRQTVENVAHHDRPAVDHAPLVDVVLAVGVEPGHLGGLAAEQGAAVFAAARGDPLDDRREHRRQEPARGDVVEEEHRDRALDQDVVDAVIDQVAADRVVPLPGRKAALHEPSHPNGQMFVADATKVGPSRFMVPMPAQKRKGGFP